MSSFRLAGNVKAFVFVAEFENHLLGTNADVKYKSSVLILLLNLLRRAGAEADSSTQLKRCYQSADITQMQCYVLYLLCPQKKIYYLKFLFVFLVLCALKQRREAALL